MFGIHHLTHINNLDNILKNELMARNKLKELDYEFTDTAENDIILKRNELNNCIPFHFSFIQEIYGIPYNYAVCKKRKPEEMIFLVATIKVDESKLLDFLLYHPVSKYSKKNSSFSSFYNNFLEEMKKYTNEIGFINYSEQEVKNLLMSELLVNCDKIKIDKNWQIWVYSQEVKLEIEKKFEKNYENTENLPEIIVDKNKIYFRKL
jgi:putative appr-1-p processing domain-containing protein